MRKIICFTHITVDGVMQAPGGAEEDPSNSFTHGGWSVPFRSEDGRKVVEGIIARKFDLLLGRRTYDIFAGFWPKQVDHPIGKAFNQATKYVVTHRSDTLAWEKSQRIEGEAAEGVRRLKASDGPEIHIWGSSNLLQTLIAADLIDEYRLFVYPVVLGKGKRLFENGVPPRGLALVETRSTSSGVVLNTYRPAGPVKS
jgi:dihydrofolate reductase